MQGRTCWRCGSVHYSPASRSATRVNVARPGRPAPAPAILARRTSTPAFRVRGPPRRAPARPLRHGSSSPPATPHATTGADAERPSPVLDASWWIPALAGPAACVARPRLGLKLRLPARLRRESSAERTGTVPDTLPLQSRHWAAARSDEIEPPATLSSQTLGQPHPRAVQGSRHPLPCLRGRNHRYACPEGRLRLRHQPGIVNDASQQVRTGALFFVGGPERSRKGCEPHGESCLTRRGRGEEGDGGGSPTGGAIPSA